MKDIIENNLPKIFVAFLLILIGVLGRITLTELLPASPSIYLNLNGITQPLFMMDLFFLIAVISILSGLILGGVYTFLVPISAMAISDVILGNNWILLFTWSGFAIIGLLFFALKSKNKFTVKKTPLLFGTSIGSVLLYDLWTNFGSYLGWYPHTMNGLTLCFTVALPFMLWHLLSTTIAFALIVMPILYLKEKEIINFKYAINPIEKPIALSLLTVIMILSVMLALV